MQTFYRMGLCSLLLTLASCATLSPTDTPTTQLSQKLDPATLTYLKTALTMHDDAQTTWQNTAGNTHYQLTGGDIYVNAKGQPCRSYQLQVRQDYERPWFTQGTLCRNDAGQWQITD